MGGGLGTGRGTSRITEGRWPPAPPAPADDEPSTKPSTCACDLVPDSSAGDPASAPTARPVCRPCTQSLEAPPQMLRADAGTSRRGRGKRSVLRLASECRGLTAAPRVPLALVDADRRRAVGPGRAVYEGCESVVNDGLRTAPGPSSSRLPGPFGGRLGNRPPAEIRPGATHSPPGIRIARGRVVDGDGVTRLQHGPGARASLRSWPGSIQGGRCGLCRSFRREHRSAGRTSVAGSTVSSPPWAAR